MTDENVFTFGIEIVRKSGSEGPNYEIRARSMDGEVVMSCKWISLENGQPFAFGSSSEQPAVEVGGTVRVEPRGRGEDGRYPGARLHLLD